MSSGKPKMDGCIMLPFVLFLRCEHWVSGYKRCAMTASFLCFFRWNLIKTIAGQGEVQSAARRCLQQINNIADRVQRSPGIA